MQMITSALEGIHSAEALLNTSAARLVGQTLGPNADVVTLSDVAVAMIQARIEMAANITAFQAEVKIEKALLDVMG
jgi:hypothetical protein